MNYPAAARALAMPWITTPRLSASAGRFPSLPRRTSSISWMRSAGMTSAWLSLPPATGGMVSERTWFFPQGIPPAWPSGPSVRMANDGPTATGGQVLELSAHGACAVSRPFGDIVTMDPTGPAGDNPGGDGAHLKDPDIQRGDIKGNYFYRFNGTSAAAPFVAGVAALVWSNNLKFKARQVRVILENTARKVQPEEANYDANQYSPSYGFGRIDPLRAVEEAIRVTANKPVNR